MPVTFQILMVFGANCLYLYMIWL